jgi:hypothetical protein
MATGKFIDFPAFLSCTSQSGIAANFKQGGLQ